jgi:hypothetical protein
MKLRASNIAKLPKAARLGRFQYLPEQLLVFASQVPPSFWHCSSVSPPAKAGTVKASTRISANIDMKVFMTFSPLHMECSLSPLLNKSTSLICQSQQPSPAIIAPRFKEAEGDKSIPSAVAYPRESWPNPIRSKSVELSERANLMWRKHSVKPMTFV